MNGWRACIWKMTSHLELQCSRFTEHC